MPRFQLLVQYLLRQCEQRGRLRLVEDDFRDVAFHGHRTHGDVFLVPNLDAIDAAIANRASRTDLKYEIDFGGTRRRIENVPIEDLLKARGTYALKYWRELNPGKIAPPVSVTFKGRY